MRVFVTGIDGFVGRHLAERLSAAGHAVEGLAATPARSVPGAARVVRCDVRDADAVRSAIGAARPEALVHLAGQTSNATAFERPAETFAVNVLGTVHVLEACARADVRRILLVTSGEVYGERDPRERPATESAPLAPITPYGASKAAQDLVGHQYARSHALEVVRARAYLHTGPGQEPRFLFPSVARRIALAETGRGPSEIELGRTDAGRDVSDVRDVVEAYTLLLERGSAGEAYNVCRGESRSLDAWLATFAAAARRPVSFVSRPERFRPADIGWMAGDPAKIAAATGWRARIAWETTVRDILDEWRARVDEEAPLAEGGGRHANA